MHTVPIIYCQKSLKYGLFNQKSPVTYHGMLLMEKSISRHSSNSLSMNWHSLLMSHIDLSVTSTSMMSGYLPINPEIPIEGPYWIRSSSDTTILMGHIRLGHASWRIIIGGLIGHSRHIRGTPTHIHGRSGWCRWATGRRWHHLLLLLGSPV